MTSTAQPGKPGTPRAAAPQALLVLQDAFDRFRGTVSAEHARTFESTTLQNVHDAALELEKRLAERDSLRNMRRILRFLDGLKHYSGAVEILCNGTPYLPYLWLASDYIDAFDKLIIGYKQIGENLPRFDRLSSALKESADFQQVLAVVYADILEFHRRAYKFVCRRGWKFFFASSWGRFDSRFKGILEDLARHSELVDKEASSIAIVEAKEFRVRWMAEVADQENDRLAAQTKNVLTWLEVTEAYQENELDRLSSHRHADSCDWVFQNAKIKQWIRQGSDHSITWLKGKPGSGKSVLCSAIVESLQENDATLVLYHFCSYLASDANNPAQMLRSFAAQIIRRFPDLSPTIYDDYVCQHLTPSVKQLLKMLPRLLSTIASVRIIVDGLDEYDEKYHVTTLKNLGELAMCNKPEGTCKILISSQDVVKIARHLMRRSQVDLSEEHSAIRGSIESFAHSGVADLHLKFDDTPEQAEAILKIERSLVEKADGMFLWVQLVLATLDNVFSLADMERAVQTLPKGLEKVYDRIFSRMKNQLDSHSYGIAVRIFEWIACAQRAVKKFEVQDGAVLTRNNHIINDDTKLSKQVFDLCKPLLEDGPNDTIRFVHASVKEYLLSPQAPLFQNAEAQFDIAYACVSYMVTSFTLVDSHYSEQQRLVDVGKGCHSLHRYANENWITHLLAYIQTETGGMGSQKWGSLLDQLQLLCKRHEQAIGPVDPQLAAKYRTAVLTEGIDARIESLRPHNEIYALTRKELECRREKGRTQNLSDLDQASSRTPHRITVFGRLMQLHDSLVQQILEAQSISGLSVETLAAFKRTYAASAFLCRFVVCPRALDGFKTKAELLEHDISHALLCSYQSCEFSKIGFRTPKALKRHLEEYHPSRETVNILRTAQFGTNTPHSDDQRDSAFSDEDEEDPALLNDLDIPLVLHSGSKRKLPAPERQDSFALATTAWL